MLPLFILWVLPVLPLNLCFRKSWMELISPLTAVRRLAVFVSRSGESVITSNAGKYDHVHRAGHGWGAG